MEQQPMTSIGEPPVALDESVDQRGGMYLTFFLDEEEYGLEILKVQEIIGMMPITPVPRTPEFIKGVVNLRGKVIPVVDLRLKFAMPSVEHTSETCIIVVVAQELQIGIIVDKVSEVADIPNADIQDTPSFGVHVQTDYILGIGRSENKVRLLLDIDRVLSQEETVTIESAPALAQQSIMQNTESEVAA